MSRYPTKYADVQAYSIAHTAQCKLHMTAKNPDRNLRFMLGHAFLLDKALFRVAEIEDMAEEEPEVGKSALGDADEQEASESNTIPEGQRGSLAGGRVAFKGDSTTDLTKSSEPKPAVSEQENTTTNQPSNDENSPPPDDDDDQEEGLGLTRFVSASQMPPRMVPDEGDEDEPDEAISPPTLPADLDVATVVQGPEDEQMGELYELVRSCPCHGAKSEKGKRFWEVKDNAGTGDRPKKRIAIMEVEAS